MDPTKEVGPCDVTDVYNAWPSGIREVPLDYCRGETKQSESRMFWNVVAAVIVSFSIIWYSSNSMNNLSDLL